MTPVPPMPVGSVRPARPYAVSPTEVLKVFLEQNLDPLKVPGGVTVGGASDKQQELGCVSLMDTGDSQNDSQTPVLWKRVQVRCMGATLWIAEGVGRHAADLCQYQRWLEIPDSNGNRWFVHEISIASGTSQHADTSETDEVLFFVNVSVGRDPAS